MYKELRVMLKLAALLDLRGLDPILTVLGDGVSQSVDCLFICFIA